MAMVYVVSRGGVDDYTLLALFSTREKAEQFIAYYPDDGECGLNQLETMEIDPPSRFPEGQRLYWVACTMDGDCIVHQCEPAETVGDHFWACTHSDRMATRCWAIDEQDAVRIANARRLKLIESGKWNTFNGRGDVTTHVYKVK